MRANRIEVYNNLEIDEILKIASLKCMNITYNLEFPLST